MTAPQFPPTVITGAQASSRKWNGVPPASVTLAQWAVEGNWGKAIPPGSNNPFGIMAIVDHTGKPREPFVMIPTHEVINGVRVACTRPLRAYEDWEDAFYYHGKLLATSPRFGSARALLPKGECPTEGTVEAYTREMAHPKAGDPNRGYATAPNYADVLISIMRGRNLYQYNV